MLKFNKKELWALPNLLGYFRIILIPIIIYLFLVAKQRSDYYLITLLVVISGISDILDGQIARRFNLITEWGKILDPLADKLTQCALLYTIAQLYPKVWYVFILFLIKETLMLLLGIFFLRHEQKIDGAKWYGKLSTAVIYSVMIILTLASNLSETTVLILTLTTGAFLFLAFIKYLLEYRKMWYQLKASQGEQ